MPTSPPRFQGSFGGVQLGPMAFWWRASIVFAGGGMGLSGWPPPSSGVGCAVTLTSAGTPSSLRYSSRPRRRLAVVARVETQQERHGRLGPLLRRRVAAGAAAEAAAQHVGVDHAGVERH